MKLFIGPIRDPVEKQEVEFVESKGIGHPDSICDDVVDFCSQALADYYRKQFGTVLHYNIDKALLVAGKSRTVFLGGKILRPVNLTIAGRVTDRIGTRKLPVRRLVRRAAIEYLSRFPLKFHVSVDVKSAASNLGQIVKKSRPTANDTSFGASHFPLSRTEQLVFDCQRYLSSDQFRHHFPCAGQDIKVMGVRQRRSVELIIAVAFISKYIGNMQHYLEKKAAMIDHLEARFKVPVSINTLDNTSDGCDSIYLTVSGLSAEMGDDGQVGRGNRYNGIITPGRPMSIEATSGKNWRHPGRAYQIAAFDIAKHLVTKKHVKSAEVKLVTNIGADLADPYVVHIKVLGHLEKKVAESVISDVLNGLVR